MKLPGKQKRLEEVTFRSQEIVQAHNTSRLHTLIIFMKYKLFICELWL